MLWKKNFIFSRILYSTSVVLVLLLNLQHFSITIRACGVLSLQIPNLKSGELTLEEYSVLNITFSFRNECSNNTYSEISFTIHSNTGQKEKVWAPQCEIVLTSTMCRGSPHPNMTCICLTNFTYMLTKTVDRLEPKYWKISTTLVNSSEVSFTLNVQEKLETTASQPLPLHNDSTHIIIALATVTGISLVCAFIMLISLKRKRKRNTAQRERSLICYVNPSSPFSRTFVAQSVTEFDFIEKFSASLHPDYVQVADADHVEPGVDYVQLDIRNSQSITQIEEQGLNNYPDEKKDNSVSSSYEKGEIIESEAENSRVRCIRTNPRVQSEQYINALLETCQLAGSMMPENHLATEHMNSFSPGLNYNHVVKKCAKPRSVSV